MKNLIVLITKYYEQTILICILQISKKLLILKEFYFYN